MSNLGNKVSRLSVGTQARQDHRLASIPKVEPVKEVKPKKVKHKAVKAKSKARKKGKK